MNCNMYLTFDGNCEEAMLYYKAIFKGEFSVVMCYSDGPPEYCNDKIADKIIHQTLVLGNGSELKASDSFHEPIIKGNNFHVSVATNNEK